MTAPEDRVIFHICSRQAYHDARAQGVYRADSLAREGFIHLSRAHQVQPTANAYFAGVPDLVLLIVDPTRLASALLYEPPAALASNAPKAASADLYPHCYGPIDFDAIVNVVELAAFDPATSTL